MHIPYKRLLTLCIYIRHVRGDIWSLITIKSVTALGGQVSPDVTAVSRDGGYSALINGNIVWLYDDTECMDREGRQRSFVSNTAAYGYQAGQNISTVQDFGVVEAGEDRRERKIYAIHADTTVGTGGWVPFQTNELNFNEEQKGRKRVAIWPGTSPTPISTTQAFLYAPLVYVNPEPQDPSKEYQARGMTLITITAPPSGPIATRQGNLVIPGTEVAYGGFSTLLGSRRTDDAGLANDRDAYLLAMTRAGLQLARVGLNDLNTFDKYEFFNRQTRTFSTNPPRLDLSDSAQIYLPGTFSCGSVFYSPHFNTFLMIYFNKMADSTFYIRYLNLEDPLAEDEVWTKGGKNGDGIDPEDAEALVRYEFSPEQKLYASPPGKGGFNYAGIAHPEYFNRKYFGDSLYSDRVAESDRRNAWYGSDVVPEGDDEADGKHLLLSWTSQKEESGKYEVQLAKVEFDDLPTKRAGEISSTVEIERGLRTSTTPTKSPHHPAVSEPGHKNEGLPKGYQGNSDALSSFLGQVTARRLGSWDSFRRALIWLGVVAVGAWVL